MFLFLVLSFFVSVRVFLLSFLFLLSFRHFLLSFRRKPSLCHSDESRNPGIYVAPLARAFLLPGSRGPQFYFRTTDVTGIITLPEGVPMVMPGDNVSISVELIAPIAMEKTQRFAIREGGRTVASGRVSEIVE